jgi:hypothetical protein
VSAAERLPVWFTEREAAEYCRCSFRAFRDMRLPAQNSGGRKVYNRATLDAALLSRPWQPSTSAEPRTTSTGAKTAGNYGALSARLTDERLRPYAPRKKQNSTAS